VGFILFFYRIEPTIRYTLAMFFHKFQPFSEYSRPRSSTIRSALWENAHPSLAAVGLLLATAGGALLPTSVLSCSPKSHMSDIAARQQHNLLQQPTNRLQPKLH